MSCRTRDYNGNGEDSWDTHENFLYTTELSACSRYRDGDSINHQETGIQDVNCCYTSSDTENNPNDDGLLSDEDLDATEHERRSCSRVLTRSSSQISMSSQPPAYDLEYELRNTGLARVCNGRARRHPRDRSNSRSRRRESTSSPSPSVRSLLDWPECPPSYGDAVLNDPPAYDANVATANSPPPYSERDPENLDYEDIPQSTREDDAMYMIATVLLVLILAAMLMILITIRNVK
ncbi:membrane protein UL56 [Spheniscid alphaherpesvirus 1]|uniref:Membrane protein UL56 n=1 Tax=Spheniscid alphaherpesvirus 1 TaxID=2560777 RepID=A0A1R3TAG0_9ALPH|nr:membrane protein UL56 [Spheniscid alphaherpesvirus 1]